MKRRWNRIPKMEIVVCFGRVRIENVDPQNNKEKGNIVMRACTAR